jgi:8-oxo-dGTP diphosphatase
MPAKKSLKKFVICVDIKGKKYKIDSNKLSFRPAVYGIIIKNGKVLLSKQWDGYDLPGGGIKIWESVDEALVREYFEETGLKIKVKDIVCCETSFHKRVFKKEFVNSILIYCLCEIIGGKLSTDFLADHEKKYISGAEWIDIRSFSKIKFYNPVDNVKIIKKALKLCQK